MEFNVNELKGEKIKAENVIKSPPPPKSVLWIGDKYYRTSLVADQRFNWFQKLMWKLCFGVNVEDYKEE